LSFGFPANLTLYKLLTDLGSLIGGIFGLLAGVALYVIGRMQVRAIKESTKKQVDAINRQNELLQKSEIHNVARTVVSAASLLEGILTNVKRHIDRIGYEFGSDTGRGIQDSEIDEIGKILVTPPLTEIIDPLGQLGHEIIESYFMLCTKIYNVGTQDIRIAPSLHRKLKNIREIIELLDSKVGHAEAKALRILRRDQVEIP
jgi:hypothetical protein